MSLVTVMNHGISRMVPGKRETLKLNRLFLVSSRYDSLMYRINCTTYSGIIIIIIIHCTNDTFLIIYVDRYSQQYTYYSFNFGLFLSQAA